MVYRDYGGKRAGIFHSKDIIKLPDRDESSVSAHLAYALKDVPYYSDVYTKFRKLGVFPKGAIPGLVFYD